MTIEIFEKDRVQFINSNAVLEKLAGGFQFTEGPVWDESNKRLIFSDIPGNTMYSYSDEAGISPYRKPSNNSNGLIYDRDGCLLACEHHTRCITREDSDGRIEVVASHYNGKRLNSPNDIIEASDGSLIFSDPHYGLMEGLGGPAEQEQPCRGVYRLAPGQSEPILLADDFDAPNGLVLSPDESILYIDDSIHQHIRQFNVLDDWQLEEGEIFAAPQPKDGEEGVPDGMKCDTLGNIYTTGPGGIWIYAPCGTLLARLYVPEVAANLAWGETNNSTLFITASTSVYRLRGLV